MNIYQDSNNTISTILYAATEEHAVPNVLYKDKEQTKPVSRKELHDLAHRGQILVLFTEYDEDYGYKAFEEYASVMYFVENYAYMTGMSYIFPDDSAFEFVDVEGTPLMGADHTIDVFAPGNSDQIVYSLDWQDVLTVREDKIYGTVNCYIPFGNAKVAVMYVYFKPRVGFNEVEDKVYGIDGKELYIDNDTVLCAYLGVPSQSNPNKMGYTKLNGNQIQGNWRLEIPFYDSVPKKNRKFEIKLKLADGTFQTTTYDCSNVNFTFTKEWGP